MVEAALELFSEHGLDKTSLGMIADKVSMTKPSIYYHFASKEDLIQRVFEHLFHDHYFSAYFQADVLDSSNFATVLYEGGLKMLPGDRNHRTVLRVVHEFVMLAERDELYRSRVTGIQQDFLNGFHHLLENGAELGVVRTPDVHLKAHLLAMVIDNMSRCMLMQLPMDYPGVWKEAVNSVMNQTFHIK